MPLKRNTGLVMVLPPLLKPGLSKKVKASGGTDMGKAIWHANHALNEEKKKFKDYLTALYVISDGQTGGELSGEKLKQFLNGQIAYWGEWWGKHIKAGILLGKKENRNILEQYFGADNTIVVDDLNRLIQEHMIRFAQDVKRYVKKLRL